MTWGRLRIASGGGHRRAARRPARDAVVPGEEAPVHSRTKRLAGLTASAVLLAGGGAAYGLVGGDPAGPRGDGTGVTPGGYRITPAGAQVPLGPLPLASALSPDG